MIYLDIILMNRDDLNDEHSTLSWIGRVLQEVITTHSMWTCLRDLVNQNSVVKGLRVKRLCQWEVLVPTQIAKLSFDIQI